MSMAREAQVLPQHGRRRPPAGQEPRHIAAEPDNRDLFPFFLVFVPNPIPNLVPVRLVVVLRTVLGFGERPPAGADQAASRIFRLPLGVPFLAGPAVWAA